MLVINSNEWEEIRVSSSKQRENSILLIIMYCNFVERFSPLFALLDTKMMENGGLENNLEQREGQEDGSKAQPTFKVRKAAGKDTPTKMGTGWKCQKTIIPVHEHHG
jgi:hypothetical protein